MAMEEIAAVARRLLRASRAVVACGRRVGEAGTTAGRRLMKLQRSLPETARTPTRPGYPTCLLRLAHRVPRAPQDERTLRSDHGPAQSDTEPPGTRSSLRSSAASAPVSLPHTISPSRFRGRRPHRSPNYGGTGNQIIAKPFSNGPGAVTIC